MPLKKILGTETEYGVTVTGPGDVSSVLVASMLVGQYGQAELRRVKWDFQEENPLRDARGFESARNREAAEEEGALVNLVLTNGARYYVDHAHPEFSTPETTNPRDCVLWDKAGEAILASSIRRTLEVMAPGSRVHVYKNNSDGKGNSYGTHENYLVDRAVPFARLAASLIPFFVTRQLYCGAGKVGCEESGVDGIEYQIGQRADFMEAEVGLETTLKRPIVNTRDEPHADPERFRRLHVICGDANLCEVTNFLKVGTAALLLLLIEDDVLDIESFTLASPVESFKTVSRDLSLQRTLELIDGRHVTAARPPVGVPRRREGLPEDRRRGRSARGGRRGRRTSSRDGSTSSRRSRPIRPRSRASSTGSRSVSCSRPTAIVTTSTGRARS